MDEVGAFMDFKIESRDLGVGAKTFLDSCGRNNVRMDYPPDHGISKGEMTPPHFTEITSLLAEKTYLAGSGNLR